MQIVEIEAGHSPYNFRSQFIQWSDKISQAWIDEDPLEILKKANMQQAAAIQEKKAEGAFAGFLDPATTTFTYEEIKGKWPKGIKGDAKEMYLSDAEFMQYLKMDKSAWMQLKAWKREGPKKAVGLF